MGSWRVSSVSKSDPGAVVIFRNHLGDGSSPCAFLSVGETGQTPWPHGGYAYIGRENHVFEIQITSGSGLTAIVFVEESYAESLVVHGHIEGGRHRFGWRELVKGKKYGSMVRKMKIHVGADGIIKFIPETKFSFLAFERELPHLEIKVPLFASPPSYEPPTSMS